MSKKSGSPSIINSELNQILLNINQRFLSIVMNVL